MVSTRFLTLFLAALGHLAFAALSLAEAIDTGDASQRGKNIQRTMRLLAESTPQKKNTVRILFYGQSITAQKWTKTVIEDLKNRFPNANIVSENRALGGYSSHLLVKTAETDLYSFQPDLVIFHVFGAHDKYEDIFKRLRERTASEILQQNDHLGAKDKIMEDTAPAKNAINTGNWNGFMNFTWLPKMSRVYLTEFCDQRAIWKSHLKKHKLQPQALLTDAVHLNEKGEAVMAAAVISYLRYDPKLGASPAEAWTRDYVVGKDVKWEKGKITLDFEGSVVELIVAPGTNATSVKVSIDGKRPSELKELYGFTRAVAKPGGHWPVIMPLHSEKMPRIEDWTMEVRKEGADDKLFSFTIAGSKTGPDGEGRSDQKFVSKSGRIVIEPEDWNVAFPMGMSGLKPVPEKFTVKWSIVPWFMDTFEAPMVVDSSVETPVILLQGLANKKHQLVLTGGTESRIRAIRIRTPMLKAEDD